MTPRTLLLTLMFMTSLSCAFADDVSIVSYYPIPYGEYENLTAERFFVDTDYTGIHPGYTDPDYPAETSGESFIGGPLLPVSVVIWGNMNMQGEGFDWFPEWDHYLSVEPNFVDAVANPVNFIAGSMKGPNGQHAFRINMYGQVTIGKSEFPLGGGGVAGPGVCDWCVDPSIKLKNLYILPSYHGYYTGPNPGPAYTYGSSDIAYVYAVAEHDTSKVGDAGKRACFGAFKTGVAYMGNPSDVSYVPLTINGSEIHLGVDGASMTGSTQAVLVGTRSAPGTGGMPGNANTLLLVNGDLQAQGAAQFSSIQYKKDIVPLGMADYNTLLTKLGNIDVVRYHYLSDDKNHKLRLGIIAEDAPREILSEDGKGISLTDSVGFLAASLKAMQQRNEVLKTRLVELEKAKAARETTR